MSIDYYRKNRLIDNSFFGSAICFDNVNETIRLQKASVIIGRDLSCDAVVGVNTVSHRHARVFSQATDWYIEDLGSKNGSYVNEKRLETNVPVRLRNGDRVRFAQLGGRFYQGGDDSFVNCSPEATVLADPDGDTLTVEEAALKTAPRRESAPQPVPQVNPAPQSTSEPAQPVAPAQGGTPQAAPWQNPYYSNRQPAQQQVFFRDFGQNEWSRLDTAPPVRRGGNRTVLWVSLASVLVGLLLLLAAVLYAGTSTRTVTTAPVAYTISYRSFFGKISRAQVTGAALGTADRVELTEDRGAVRAAEFKLPGGGTERAEFSGFRLVRETVSDKEGTLLSETEYDPVERVYTTSRYSGGELSYSECRGYDGTLTECREYSGNGYLLTTYSNGGHRQEWVTTEYVSRARDYSGDGITEYRYAADGTVAGSLRILEEVKLSYCGDMPVNGSNAHAFTPDTGLTACESFTFSFSYLLQPDSARGVHTVWYLDEKGVWNEAGSFRLDNAGQTATITVQAKGSDICAVAVVPPANSTGDWLGTARINEAALTLTGSEA